MSTLVVPGVSVQAQFDPLPPAGTVRNPGGGRHRGPSASGRQSGERFKSLRASRSAGARNPVEHGGSGSRAFERRERGSYFRRRRRRSRVLTPAQHREQTLRDVTLPLQRRMGKFASSRDSRADQHFRRHRPGKPAPYAQRKHRRNLPGSSSASGCAGRSV